MENELSGSVEYSLFDGHEDVKELLVYLSDEDKLKWLNNGCKMGMVKWDAPVNSD